MGQKKPAAKKAKKSTGSKIVKTAVSALSGMKSSSGGGRRSKRMTPEKLSKAILVEKLKKRLFKIKYGGGR